MLRELMGKNWNIDNMVLTAARKFIYFLNKFFYLPIYLVDVSSFHAHFQDKNERENTMHKLDETEQNCTQTSIFQSIILFAQIKLLIEI